MTSVHQLPHKVGNKYLWLGVSSLGIAVASVAGAYITHDPNPLWALILIPILWNYA